MIALHGIAVSAGLLFVLACIGRLAARRTGSWAIAVLCLVVMLLDLGFLASGAAPVVLVLPVGVPGAGATLALDGLSGAFLLPPALIGLAVAPLAGSRLVAALLGAMLLTVLAGDGFTLLLGFGAMSATSFLAILAGGASAEARRAALPQLGMASIGAACLLGALGMLLPPGDVLEAGFVALRVHPPEGWRAGLVLALALAGAGSTAGLAPLHVWLPPAHAATPSPVSALLSGAMTKVALYVLVRLVFDLCGPVRPLWWGVPLVVLGVGSGLIGAVRATIEEDTKTVLACSTVGNVGLIVAALGFALIARAADLPALAALALGAALLQSVAHGLFKSLLFLVAGAVQAGAGTRRLDRLGGLIHRMPATTFAALVGAGCMAGLPLFAAFPGDWMLLQASVATPRIGGFPLQMLCVVAALLIALTLALGMAAALRFIGIAFLGRPRSPRAAAAEEVARPWRLAMAGLAGASLLVGLFPSSVLTLIAPALRMLLGADLAGQAGLLVIAPRIEAPGYQPAVLAMLFLAGVAAIGAVARARAAQGRRAAPAWDGGFGAAPAWLPFGDPLTQPGAAGISRELRRIMAGRYAARDATGEMVVTDPVDRHLMGPVGTLRNRMSGLSDQLRLSTTRGTLVATVVLLAGLLGWVSLA